MCFAGTITGLVLALCLAGKFLISQNLATILYFVTELASGIWLDDITVVALIFLCNAVIWGPIK